MAEKESIRLTARTGEFTRIVERATESSAAQPSRTSHTSLLKSHYRGRQCSLFCSCAPSPREYTVSRGVPDNKLRKNLCLVVFSVKAQNELSDLKYTFLVVANNNKMIDYLSKRIIKLF